MMAWPEELQHRNGEWPDAELLESVNFYPSDERAQHGASNFLSTTSQSAPGLTSSASCPSFSGLENAFVGGEATGDVLIPLPFSSEEPLLDTIRPGEDTPFPGDKDYNMLRQFQQEYQNLSQRQFPHQHIMNEHLNLTHQQQMPGGRRGLQGSQSYTNLSSMESEYHHIDANSKRKKGSERWMKLQRHKSFDSSTTVSEPVYSESDELLDSAMSSNPTPDQLLREPPDSDIGFFIDDFSSISSSDPNWPLNIYGSAPSSTGLNYPPHVQQKRQSPHQHQQQISMQSAIGVARADSVFESAEVEPVSELELLLSENEQANLFDAIRNFESPPMTKSVEAQPSPKHSTQQFNQKLSPITPQTQGDPFRTGKKDTATGLPCFPGSNTKSPHDTIRPLALDSSSSVSPAGMPPSGCVPMRTRLHQILVHSVQNSDAGSSLSSYERNYLMQSPLFFPPKAPETAGSLWLLLHAAQCDSGCEIAGCSVMRRVLNHCLGCDLTVGKCKPICNDAKAMLLHYGSCNSKGSMHGRSCSVCWNLLEIDYSHQLLSNGTNNGRSSSHTPNSTPSSFMSPSQIDAPPLVPKPMSPGRSSSPVFHSPSSGPTTNNGSGVTKHVPIQPNPLPTASNPMGLMGALPPHFKYSLSLYLEQTSARFRAEIQSRIEKRVTAAAGQDLLQHMQKKTRLRSLDDLRLEARAIVLGEMERELHLHVQAFNWANSTSSGTFPERATQLPPYLLNLSVAGFNAFHA